MGTIRVVPKQGPTRVKVGTPAGQVLAAQIAKIDDTKAAAQASADASAASAADAAASAADAAAALGATFATVDSGTATLISNPVAGPNTQAALMARLAWIDPHTEHGALGNGTANDASALQAALNAAGSGTRKTVRLQRGLTYRLGSHITVPNGVELDGNGATLKPLSSSIMRAIQITGSSTIVRDLTIDMNKAETANGANTTDQQGILINAAPATVSNVQIRRVTVRNSWQRGIVAQASGTNLIKDITIDDCTVEDVGDRGIHLGGTGSATNTGITVTRCRVRRSAKIAIIAQGCSGILIDACEATGDASSVDSGIVISATGAISRSATVRDCTVTGFGTSGRWGIVATVGVQQFKITGNVIQDCAGGITCDPEDPTALGVQVDVAGTIANNSIRNTTASHGINARMCNSLAITGNTVEDVYDTGIAVSSATGVTITGNNLARIGNNGVGLFGTSTGGGHTVGMNVIRQWATRVGGGLRVRQDATPTANTFPTTQATP